MHDMEEAYFENNRVDALIMERLTSSPYVMNIYGFCGMTVVTEFAGKTISDVANQLPSSVERLNLAIEIAQGLTDLHSVGNAGRPTIVHNDLNPANLMITHDHRPVYNDFNIAILLMVHNETNQTCPFLSRYPNPQWRSPEEQVLINSDDHDPDEVFPQVTEKVDIYALGNVLFRLAVGINPWKKPGTIRILPEDKLRITHLKMNGTLPYIPDEIRHSNDTATVAMLLAMKDCYRWDPATRPTASQVLSFLQTSRLTIP
jgi:serine/threonine protein kinase